MFMFFNSLMEVSHSITNVITCITQVTFKLVNNTLLITRLNIYLWVIFHKNPIVIAGFYQVDVTVQEEIVFGRITL